MPDPFLLAHKIAPAFYDIGGSLFPISIRDQMLRARLIVDRAKECGLIGKDSPMLIIGAGAAGVTAALRSLELGVRTVLIEKENAPFTRQRNCKSRYLAPFQYDWPSDHWEKDSYPWGLLPSLPLPLKDRSANLLAHAWFVEMEKARMKWGTQFTVEYETEYVSRSLVSGHKWQYTYRSNKAGGTVTSDNFGAALACIGAGIEGCKCGKTYRGFSFWENDPYEMRDLSLKNSHSARVLISGGGDGALQDFLRIVTGKQSAKEIYHKLPESVKRIVEPQIYSAEDRAMRGYHLGENLNRSMSIRRDCSVLKVLHQNHLDIIDKIWRTPLKEEIIDIFNDENFPLRGQVCLSFPCSHFSRCYALNRFLVLLVNTYLVEIGKSDCIRPGRRTEGISPVYKHKCGDASVCHGKQHSVTFSQVSECIKMKALQRTNSTTEEYEIVVVRHPSGLYNSVVPAFRSHRFSSRQVLPYYPPWY